MSLSVSRDFWESPSRFAVTSSTRLERNQEGKSRGSGTYAATAALTDVGEWQVRVTLYKGNQQTQVKFTLRVGANI